MSFGERGDRDDASRHRGRAQKPKQKRPPNVTRAGLEASALRYLERFDCSSERLRKFLSERVAKAARAGVEGAALAPAIIDELLQRYRENGLLNDERFAANFAQSLRGRGGSRRVIELKLRARGISGELAKQALQSGESPATSELEAAQAFARRRRLGPHRKPEQRAEFRQKDLMALARAGFDFDTAKRVIGNSTSSDDEF
ncbi:MAG: RecX family transcriptional regulator [Myxococcales bacterium]